MFQSRFAKIIWVSTRPKNCFENGNCAVTVGDDISFMCDPKTGIAATVWVDRYADRHALGPANTSEKT